LKEEDEKMGSWEKLIGGTGVAMVRRHVLHYGEGRRGIMCYNPPLFERYPLLLLFNIAGRK
jgi:hypothetical protein